MEKKNTLDGYLIENIRDMMRKEMDRVGGLISNAIQNEFPPYMNLTTASEYLGISKNTLNKYIQTEEIIVIRFDGVKRIAKTDLDKFMMRYRC